MAEMEAGHGIENFNALTAWERWKTGEKMPYPVEANKPPELRFVEGLGPMYLEVHGGPVHEVGTLDPWVTRYPGSKMKGMKNKE